MLRPQSMVAGPVDDSHDEFDETDGEWDVGTEAPLVALLDGLPMAQHDRLSNRLVVDDPDDFAVRYGAASEQRHGTAMASLVLHGDLNATNPGRAIRGKVYVRPVMYAQPDGLGSTREAMPPDRLAVDLIWTAFIRMFDGESGDDPVAPTVRVVNLSLGDAKRRFFGLMSPWARLLDYLSWTYRVLIVVSAGNVLDPVPIDGLGFWSDFENAAEEERQVTMLRAILQQRAYRTLLSPSESINALTVGAAHADNVGSRRQAASAVDPYQCQTLPNPSSALGLGFRRSVKPEVLFPGGAEQVRSLSTQAPIEASSVKYPGHYFGIGVASPGVTGDTDRKINMTGTSVSAALATHGALRILDALGDLGGDDAHQAVDPEYHSVLLKALLVHGAGWDQETVEALKPIINEGRKLHWQHEREEIGRLLGFGCPNIDRVVDCEERRATLIGWGRISARQTDRFRIPLPAELEGVAGFRALSVTIAWFTPITLSHRMYRLAKLFAGPGSDRGFSIGVANSKLQPSPSALGRGTIYHHRWEGDEAADFVDDGSLLLDVTCSPTTGEMDESVPYAVAASLEVGATVAVPIYESIRQRLRVAV